MSRRSPCATRCACSSPRRWRSSAPHARASCASASPRLVALLDRAIVQLLPAVPRPVVRRLSSRYIAGAELEDAVRVVREQNALSKLATIDVLGEETSDGDEARTFT